MRSCKSPRTLFGQGGAVRHIAEIEDRVALAREAFLQLHGRGVIADCAAGGRSRPRPRRSFFSDPRGPGGADARSLERGAAAALRAPVGELRIASIERDVEPSAGSRSRCVALNTERCAWAGSPITARIRRSRRGRSSSFAVRLRIDASFAESSVGRDRASRRRPGEQMQVVIHDARRQRRRSREDDPRARHPQEHQHAEHAFLVMPRGADRGQDPGSRLRPGTTTTVRGPRVVLEALEQRSQPRLQRREAGKNFIGSRSGHGNTH